MMALAVLNAPTVPCNTDDTGLGLAVFTVVKAQACAAWMLADVPHWPCSCSSALHSAQVPCIDQVT